MKSKSKSLVPKVSLLIVTEILIGLSASIASLLIFMKLAVNIESIQAVDMYLSAVLYELRTPLLTNVMIVASYFGQELVLVFFGIVLLLLLMYQKRRDALLFAFIFFTGAVINLSIKGIISRDRPTLDPLFQELFYSFPSFHAMNSFIFYSLSVLFIYRISRNRKYTLVSFLMCALVVLFVGISRVYLGVHYPSDVFAGYIAGLWWIATVLVIDKTFSLFLRKKKNGT